MQNVALTWQQGAVLAGGLYAAAFAASRVRSVLIARTWPFLREAGTIALLYTGWQLIGALATASPAGAYSRGAGLVDLEAELRFPREARIQGWIVPHPWLSQVCNLYYAGLHFPVLFAMLLWVFVRHRDRYARVRASVIVLTASCFAIQLVPVAPPRLVPRAGVIDMAARYGQSVYASGMAGVDQLSAMPSVHVGWAALVAVVAIRTSNSHWRWIALAYPLTTTFVVVATGNHFWLDGLVAIMLLAVGEVTLTIWARTQSRSHRSAELEANVLAHA